MARKRSKTPLSITHPDLAAQWHLQKNGITPDQVVAGSNKKYWWICDKGPDHEWSAMVNSRSRGNGCPFCARQKASVTNSLASINPEIAAQLHPTKNDGVTADQIVAGSNRKYWWTCDKGPDHEWTATAGARSRRDRPQQCLCCAGFKASVTNSLASLFPDVAAQLHPTKNDGVTADQIVAGTEKKYWWVCPEGPDHEWQAHPQSRTKQGSGCPYCSGRTVSATNSLATLFPTIASQLHPTKNNGVTADQIVAGSGIKYWWICQNGPDHEWLAVTVSRTNQGVGCPYCSHQKVSVTNSLATRFPDVAAQLHPTKNNGANAEQIIAGSQKTYWWICSNGPDHEWRMPATARTSAGQGCPFCSSQRVSITNSLATRFPDIAAQLHPTKNPGVDPDRIIAGSHTKYWWKCVNGLEHEWFTSPSSRIGHLTGCPFCSVFPRSRQEISLAFELLSVFDFDIRDHKVETEGGFYDCDIVIRRHGLIVEFDGSYWHADKYSHDVQKTELLTSEGWDVIRVREQPLDLISPMDVSVPLDLNVKAAADAVLLKIQSDLNINSEKLSAYLLTKDLQNEVASQAFILQISHPDQAHTFDVHVNQGNEWEFWYALLEKFASSEGHARPPKDYKEDGYSLGQWVTANRTRQHDLSRELISRLEALPGWTWDSKSFAWEKGYSALLKFVSREGHARPPRDFKEDGYRLGQWVNYNRSLQHDLSRERVSRLEVLPGWIWSVRSFEWEEGYSALLKFVSREGHARPLPGHIEGDFKLGRWVRAQRTQRTNLTPERARQLEILPEWIWDVRSFAWEEGYSALQRFAAREGHARPPTEYQEEGYRLGQWVNTRRGERKKLTHERVQQLEALPEWTWGARGFAWEEGYSALQRFTAREGHARPPKEFKEDGYPLGQWVGDRRSLRASLVPERVRQLEALPGWVWDANEFTWEEGFSALQKFTAREGHSRPAQSHKEGGYNLGQWVRRMRATQAGIFGYSLDPERIRQLEGLPGWAWDANEYRWEQGMSALQRFTTREGHARPPKGYKEDGYNLGSWVRTQRNTRNNLPAERVSRLEALPGWAWDARTTSPN